MSDLSDSRLMTRLSDLEVEIGAPGFWERLPDAVRDVCKEHVSVLNEAIDRGLTEF